MKLPKKSAKPYCVTREMWGAFDRRGRLLRYEDGQPVVFRTREHIELHVRLTHTDPERKPWGTARRVKVTVEAIGPAFLVME